MDIDDARRPRGSTRLQKTLQANATPGTLDHPIGSTSGSGRVRRLWILSDLHLDTARPAFEPPEIPRADVAVLAGDICRGLVAAIEWAARTIRPHMPVVMVAGNREYHGAWIDEEATAGAAVATREGVDLLENRTVEVAGLRFSGCTLWTDYALNGEHGRAAAMTAAARHLSDHRAILSGRSASGAQRFLPEAAYQRHVSSRLFFSQTLLATHTDAARQVVITHHAPLGRSIDASLHIDPLGPAYASDLDDLLAAAQPALWIHGHAHTSRDYRVRATRVICNALGHAGENPRFDPSFTVDVSP